MGTNLARLLINKLLSPSGTPNEPGCQNSSRNIMAMTDIACVAGGIVRVRGKILTAESEYGRRSREENGEEPL